MTTTIFRNGRDALLDASIVCSFDRSGFLRHARSFTARDLEVDLAGRVCLVTGANSGIGYETSLALAQRGASVWMLCRDRVRGEHALAQVRRQSRSRRVQLALLDVSDLDAVRAFAAGLAEPRVDVLVHNAGVLPDQRLASPPGRPRRPRPLSPLPAPGVQRRRLTRPLRSRQHRRLSAIPWSVTSSSTPARCARPSATVAR